MQPVIEGDEFAGRRLVDPHERRRELKRVAGAKRVHADQPPGQHANPLARLDLEP